MRKQGQRPNDGIRSLQASIVLLTLALGVALLFLVAAPSHAILPLHRRNSHAARPAPSQRAPMSARDKAARAAQDQLLQAGVIHSRQQFQPHMHLPQYPQQRCTCPDEESTEQFAGLRKSAQELTEPLGTPTRIAMLNGSHSATADLFADVYVVNLSGRTDRQHYMCLVLRHLRIPAVLWPAFPRRHAIVRQYAMHAKNANFNPIMDYAFLKPPEPQPQQPAARQTTAEQVDSGLGSAHRKRPGPHLRTSEAACYLSHREIWLDVQQRQLDAPILVLEDDVEVEQEFVHMMRNALRALPHDWAVLWVGSCFEEMYAHSHKLGHRCAHSQQPDCRSFLIELVNVLQRTSSFVHLVCIDGTEFVVLAAGCMKPCIPPARTATCCATIPLPQHCCKILATMWSLPWTQPWPVCWK
jgi:GR25 family glycosyltransferase involved in LPS biosynthesis